MFFVMEICSQKKRKNSFVWRFVAVGIDFVKCKLNKIDNCTGKIHNVCNDNIINDMANKHESNMNTKFK